VNRKLCCKTKQINIVGRLGPERLVCITVHTLVKDGSK